MTPSDRYLYEYSVVRYVPRVDREEFINIGLIMMCKRQKWLKGEVSLNLQRIQAFDPEVNLERLFHQLKYIKRMDIPAPDLPVEEKYRWLCAVKSAVIQTSPSHPGLIIPKPEALDSKEILEEEFNRLLSQLIL